ncbi:OmpA family protein [Sphingorhabdus sp. Alg239-R122]|uniref:OmpA family protein n=1 Tax=Sphingorhabdus sp. Alg239-R122 TaxID=2305989 RepID=UPI0013DA0A64|nr:OmpA family protein [Sphingorhabdus sp. Alg239-R122]
MNSFKKTSIMLSGVAALGLSACVTNPETGNKVLSKTAIGGVAGAVGGYFLGDLVGGRRDRTEKILGAGIGAVAGAGVGYYLDKQQKELERKTEGTGVDVVREGDSLILNMPSQVTFGVDSSAIQPNFQSTLAEVAGTLKEYEKTYIDVYGHTDSTGSDSYNQGLSERRAGSVASYLTGQGVQSARLATQGFGESQPIATNTTEEGRAANRRVEIRIVPVTEEDVQGT